MTSFYVGEVDRRISSLLEQLVTEEPVVALHGPRSVGKSTVLRTFARRHDTEVVDLDDPVTRDAVAANPILAVAGAAPLCLDEYQHVPELLDALKARLNRDAALPGTAVLTGSTRHDALPRTAQTLTGRLHSLIIWPLSQGELAGARENLVECLRVADQSTVSAIPTSTTDRADYARRIVTGGFPLAVRRRDAARTRWFADYVRSSIERDAVELSRVRQRQVLADLLRRMAGQTAQVFNASEAATALDVDRRTIEEHTRLLEDLFLVSRLPAWGKSLRSRTTAKPKIHVVDSGLAAYLMRINPAKLATLDPTVLTEFGHLLETFVVSELRKQVSWLDESVTIGHWRTSDGDEVDMVVEFDDGGILAFEVKTGERVSGAGFTGLRKLRNAVGDRFIAGVAFSTGTRSYTYDDRLHVLPVDRIWQEIDLKPVR
ncbi:MAG: ATP-binding protein [Pseudonocardia sp.]|nr:ATP-binding protein [Pseudonocardia sp.]